MACVIIANQPSHLLKFYLIVLFSIRLSLATLVIKNQPPLRYIRDGDINLGGVISGLNYASEGLCGDDFFMTTSFHFSESIVYAIDMVNNNQSLLPNITLGFVILDDCTKESTSAIQAISFFKDMESSSPTCSANPYAGSADRLPMYDVVGAIGCLRSPNSMAAAQVLGPAQIPLVSYTSTTDVLDDKEMYPYFLRVVPSDTYLVYALFELIRQFKWRYVSVLYAAGSFGEGLYESLREVLSQTEDICIATSHKIYQKTMYVEYLWIMKDLIANKKARVIITFTDPDSVIPLLSASHELGASGWFVWLLNDSWKFALGTIKDKKVLQGVAGAIVTGFQSLVSKPYAKYATQLNPNNTYNPWFHRLWRESFSCNVSETACYTDNNVTDLLGDNKFTYAENAYDAVLTYAHGIESVLDENCPGVVGKAARDCITGPKLLEAMKNSSFFGPTGLIEFDDNGNVLAKFMVEQLQTSVDFTSYEVLPVAIYNARTKEMKYLQNISFDYILQEGFRDGVPESFCSEPCGPGEFTIMKTLNCCWDCRKCRSNEILIYDSTDCMACPDLTWPDELSNFTTCLAIIPDYPVISEPLVLLCLALSTLGLIGVAMVTWCYFKYRDARVIKASSKELSYLQLMAIITGYLTVPVLSVKPGHDVCVTAYFMYCLSFAWLYAPLLVKTIRIHRIFTGSKKHERLKYVSPKWQIVFACLLISVQVFLCILTTIMFHPTSSLKQAIKTEKFAELSCDWTVPGLSSFLGYNLVLVFLCSVFAFKTRKLPDNFNESRFISLCVYTTLIIWLAFVPAYFTAERQYLKSLLLSLSLLVNHTVAVVFLYLPKIYAAVNLIPTTTDNLRTGINAMSSTYGNHLTTQTTTSCPTTDRLDPLRTVTPKSLGPFTMHGTLSKVGPLATGSDGDGSNSLKNMTTV